MIKLLIELYENRRVKTIKEMAKYQNELNDMPADHFNRDQWHDHIVELIAKSETYEEVLTDLKGIRDE